MDSQKIRRCTVDIGRALSNLIPFNHRNTVDLPAVGFWVLR